MKVFERILTVFFFLLVAVTISYGQANNRIVSQCIAPNQLVSATTGYSGSGDLFVAPCPTKTTFFSGTVDFSGATVIGGGGIGGSGTTNFIPRFTASTTLGNTPFSWDGTTYVWNNTALTAEFRMLLTPFTGGGNFSVGDFATTPTTFFTLAPASATFSLTANSVNKITGDANDLILGDADGVGTEIYFRVSNALDAFTFNSASGTAVMNLSGVGNFDYSCVATPSGTTGNRTINFPCGTVNFAALATDIVITNSTVTTNSLILCTIQSLDTTAISCRVTDKAANSFHIRVPAATAETSVMFSVMN